MLFRFIPAEKIIIFCQGDKGAFRAAEVMGA